MAHHIVIEALDIAVEQLNKDLHILIHMIKMDGKSIAINHDNTNIRVHLPLQYKAYVPKRYTCFDVLTFEWEGDDELDMNTIIELKKHGIFIS